MVVEPSPKFQNRLVIVPVEVSVKATVTGFRPLVGLAKKFAIGTRAPVPRTELAVLPPVLVKLRTLLKLAALVEVKRTTRLVVPKPGRLKGVPNKIVNGPALIEAEPLVSRAPPRLVRTKLAWAFVPTATMPKSMLAGETAS